MAEKRKKFNWLFIIEDQHKEYDFSKYKKEHFKVKSEKRLARSFVKKNKLPLHPCYEVGHEEPAFEFISRTAFGWIDE